MKYLILILSVIGGIIFLPSALTKKENVEVKEELATTLPAADSFSLEDYRRQLDSIHAERKKLALQLEGAQKAKVLEEAGKLLINSLNNVVFEAWMATDYDFYGATEQPKCGQIACGYFVTTVLRDAGVRLDRIALAETYSEYMVKTLSSAKNISRFKNVPFNEFEQKILKQGDELYVVGLDNHTVFMLSQNNKLYFIHAYYPGVMKQEARNCYFLKHSRYRIAGNLSKDAQFLQKWLNEVEFESIFK